MDLAAVSVLASEPGWSLLEELVGALDEGRLPTDPLALVSSLRRSHPPELAAALTEQLQLRPRARRKLGDLADRLLVTGAGLEQTTRPAVAAHRAARLTGALGPEAVVADLGCGIGGEVLALGRAAPALRLVGAELDPVTARVAASNVARLGLASRAVVARLDVTGASLPLPNVDAVVADPARRTAGGRRVFDPDAYSPPWSWVMGVLGVLGGRAVVKVAPGIPHDVVPEGCEAEWVSDGGDLVEAALWSPSLRTSRRRATLLPSGLSLTEADDPGPEPPVEPGRYLYEPDPSTLRAGLVTAVAAVLGARQLHPDIAYLTGEALTVSPWARAYEVHDVLPYSEKTLRQELRRRDIGVLTVKKRGGDVDPEVLRKRMRLSGTAAATLVVTRLAPRAGTATGQAVALLTQPVPPVGRDAAPPSTPRND